MTKREVCTKYPVIGGWSVGLAFLQIHHIAFGIEEFIYCSYVYSSDVPASYHRLMAHISTSGRTYVIFGGSRYYLEDAIRY